MRNKLATRERLAIGLNDGPAGVAARSGRVDESTRRRPLGTAVFGFRFLH
jgi:hypothetical protein